MKYQINERRPIKARGNPFSQRIAGFLAGLGVSPNSISASSMVFAAGAGLSFAATAVSSLPIWWLSAAALILLRLLANMFDGMVAVQTEKASALGEVFNELPDRISDAVILIGAGYAAGSLPELGYVTAVLAVFIAYVRVFGNYLGVSGLFMGPMGKQHRMFVLIAVCLVQMILPLFWQEASLLTWVLPLVILGCIITIIRRLSRIVTALKAKE